MTSSFESPIFRRSMFGVGLLLLAIYGLMLIPVAVNLPASWPGLAYILIGLVGGFCSFAFLRYRRRLFLVPVTIATLMTLGWIAAILLFGEAIDRQLHSGGDATTQSVPNPR